MHVCNSYITDHLWLSTEQWWTPAHGCGKLVHHVAPSATQPDIQQKHQFNGIIVFQGNRVSWYQKGRIILKFSKGKKLWGFGMAVALAGPYADNLHADSHDNTGSADMISRKHFDHNALEFAVFKSVNKYF